MKAMVTGMVKPRVVVSKCLEFDKCRYDGSMIRSPLVAMLKPVVEFVPVCPEVEAGLGVPRDPIRITGMGEERRLIQPSTGRDFTAGMRRFIDEYLGGIGEVDGFILKSRSPSCGFTDVKLYSEKPGVTGPSGKGSGFFGAEVMKRFGDLAVEDEGRLNNFRIREHFLTKLFAIARFRKERSAPSMSRLVKFQAENKLLLMSYNQTGMRKLGRIVANHERIPVPEVFGLYSGELRAALMKPPRYTSNINVLMHALGYFSEKITAREKSFFLESLERYRLGKIPLSSPIHIVRSWIARFGTEYLADQTFFDPYPEQLVEITDSGKGRDL